MWKRSISGALLAAASLLPAAQAQTIWSFSYTGFERDGVFDPAYRLSGGFVGSDLDSDGILQQAELTRFFWDGNVYDPLDMGYCAGGGDCSVSDFRYSLDGQLDFRFDWRYSDEMAYSRSSTIAGDYMDFYGYVGSGEPVSLLWRWTDATRFEISPAPVPEPGQAAMLAAGLGALAALGVVWRRSRPKPRLIRRPLRA